ncbi:hypothetical protein BU17DRAFT_99290 [Hysterangium stoloniferum]|nr:hypothetical protein BU17DRAFT_99290 [Hysterangium stoloniferum]
MFTFCESSTISSRSHRVLTKSLVLLSGLGLFPSPTNNLLILPPSVLSRTIDRLMLFVSSTNHIAAIVTLPCVFIFIVTLVTMEWRHRRRALREGNEIDDLSLEARPDIFTASQQKAPDIEKTAADPPHETQHLSLQHGEPSTTASTCGHNFVGNSPNDMSAIPGKSRSDNRRSPHHLKSRSRSDHIERSVLPESLTVIITQTSTPTSSVSITIVTSLSDPSIETILSQATSTVNTGSSSTTAGGTPSPVPDSPLPTTAPPSLSQPARIGLVLGPIRPEYPNTVLDAIAARVVENPILSTDNSQCAEYPNMVLDAIAARVADILRPEMAQISQGAQANLEENVQEEGHDCFLKVKA